jgi:hypothetical protein
MHRLASITVVIYWSVLITAGIAFAFGGLLRLDRMLAPYYSWQFALLWGAISIGTFTFMLLNREAADDITIIELGPPEYPIRAVVLTLERQSELAERFSLRGLWAIEDRATDLLLEHRVLRTCEIHPLNPIVIEKDPNPTGFKNAFAAALLDPQFANLTSKEIGQIFWAPDFQAADDNMPRLRSEKCAGIC